MFGGFLHLWEMRGGMDGSKRGCIGACVEASERG